MRFRMYRNIYYDIHGNKRYTYTQHNPDKVATGVRGKDYNYILVELPERKFAEVVINSAYDVLVIPKDLDKTLPFDRNLKQVGGQAYFSYTNIDGTPRRIMIPVLEIDGVKTKKPKRKEIMER